jgi:hypothetical protein
MNRAIRRSGTVSKSIFDMFFLKSYLSNVFSRVTFVPTFWGTSRGDQRPLETIVRNEVRKAATDVTRTAKCFVRIEFTTIVVVKEF